jgi:hypothetical protein
MRKIKYSELRKRVSNKEKEITDARKTNQNWEVKWNGDWYQLTMVVEEKAQGGELMNYIVSIGGGDD